MIGTKTHLVEQANGGECLQDQQKPLWNKGCIIKKQIEAEINLICIISFKCEINMYKHLEEQTGQPNGLTIR